MKKLKIKINRELFLEIFWESKPALIGLIGIIVFVSIAVLSPVISPQNPYDLTTIDIMDGQLPPGSTLGNGKIAYLGTDDQGRDMLSAVFYGLRLSLFVSLIAASIGTALGVILGLFAAFYGNWVDNIIMRFVDMKMAFPGILLALMLLAILGQGVDKVIIALIVGIWASKARLIRSAAISEMKKEYITAARISGMKGFRIIFRYLLPNSISPVLVVFPMAISGAIAGEATLSFLGVGVPITEPSLGLLIANGFDFLLADYWWISIIPGVTLVILVLSINVVADRVREYYNPQLRND